MAIVTGNVNECVAPYLEEDELKKHIPELLESRSDVLEVSAR